MPNLTSRHFAVYVGLLTGLAQAVPAAEILIVDAKSQPESLTFAGGTLFVGSAFASTPFVYKVNPKSGAIKKFVDASAEGAGTFFFGMLADTSTKTLWTCQLTPQGDPSARPVKRHTALRGFNLSTGAEKLRWNLPGENSTCNDFSIGPDKALYITDTANAKIYKLPAGASNAELFLEDTTNLRGIDGITFLNGTLYVNSVSMNKIYRIPVDAAHKAGTPVEIALDQPIKGPDGMRAANGKLLVAENGSGKISVITVNGDRGTVTVIKEGLKTPTGVEPAGHTIWIAERGAGQAVSMPMPK
jgi:sugar lactone lactonase YvrE